MTGAPRLLDRIGAHPRAAAALIVAHDDGDEVVSYGGLLDGAEAWAGRLAEAGLAQGDAIAVWLPNIAAWPMLELAAARLGLIVVPINTRWKAAELRQALVVSQPRLIVMPEEFCGIAFEAILAEAMADLPAIRIPLRAEVIVARAPSPVPADLPLNLFATSGSTGVPKLAVHRQSALVTRFYAAATRFTIDPGDRLLCVLPLCGVWGLGIVLAGLMRGATCVLAPVFDPDEAAALMGRLDIGHLHGGDNLILSLIASSRLSPTLPHWRTCYFGAFTGRAAGETIAAIEAKGGRRLRAAQAYGSSEALAFVAGSAPSAPLSDRAVAGGPLLDDATEVRVVDPETGLPAESGELQLRGATVAEGYLNNPEATAAAFTADGWYRTGDFGHATPGGAVFVARMGDTLRLRGNLVDAGDIEHHLCAHPDVAEAHVVGVNLPDRGDVAVAFVRLRAGSTANEAALLAFARARMASFKLPERIFSHVEIPVTIGANGAKVKKGELRAIAQDYLRTPPIT